MRRVVLALAVVLCAHACSPEDDAAPPLDAARPPADANAGAARGLLAGQDCLVIVLDALHAARLGCYGHDRPTSPHIDALAASGLRFARARSNQSWTLPSTATLFTGLYQETHGLHFDLEFEEIRLADSVDTLAEQFRAAGYDTHFSNQNPFAGRRYGLDQGFDDYVDHYWTARDEMLEAAVAKLGAPADRPRFVYVHARQPHTPFDATDKHRALFTDPDYAGWATGSEKDLAAHNNRERPMQPDDMQRHADLYDATIHDVDEWLGRLLARIDRSRTLVVLLSDHGEAVGQHGKLGHNWHSFEEYVHIPLIFAHPALATGTRDEPVSTVDVMPTLLELFDLPAPSQALQGRSFTALTVGRGNWTPEPVFTTSRLLKGRQDLAVVSGPWKYIRGEPGGRELLYDLAGDPGETRNVVAEQPEQTARLRALLLAWRSPQQRRYIEASEGLDEETLQHLRELGYVR
jgi:arylsulfatase A-like enzyme